MRTKTIDLYTAQELKDICPAGFTRALEKHRERVAEDNFTADEAYQSLKGLFDACSGVKLGRHELGAYMGRASWLRAEFTGDPSGAEDLKGARAWSWLENNLLSALRVPHVSIQAAREAQAEYYAIIEENMERRQKEGRGARQRVIAEYLKRQRSRLYNKPGAVASCPFTGICFDDQYIDALRDAIKGGDTVREALEGLAAAYEKIVEGDIEWRSTEAAFLEEADANEWEFTADGEME